MNSNTMKSTLLVGAVALAMMTVFMPSAMAQSSAFGGQLQAGDTDTTYQLQAAAGTFNALCFVDDDGSSSYNPGESVYATTAAGCAGNNVQGNDLRITSAAGQDPGSQVRATHSDFGNPYTAFTAGANCANPAEVDFYDADGDGTYSLDDPVFVDVCDTGQVAVGDIHLTGSSAGSTVQSGDSSVNNNLNTGTGGNSATNMDVTAWTFFDADGDTSWTAGDTAYIDADTGGAGNPFVTIIDVRLGSVAGESFGSQVQDGDSDVVYQLAGGTMPFTALCFVDDDGSSSYNPGESVYATTVGACGGNSVQGNDLRITSAAGQDPGSQVRATHSDFGNPYTAFTAGANCANPAEVDFYDADGDGTYSLDDPVFVDVCDTGQVAVGDIHLTGSSAGQTVKSGDSSVNNNLNTGSGDGSADASGGAGVSGSFDVTQWTFFDADGDTSWTAGDTTYIDADSAGTAPAFATIIDIRLGSVAGESFGSQVVEKSSDVVYELAAAAPTLQALCFVDDDGSSSYNPGESVYATTAANCGGSVLGNDLRITSAAGQDPGSQVRATHSDFGNPYTAFTAGANCANPAEVDFYDADGDAAYSQDDPVFIDVCDTGQVAVGDIHLTGSSAGSTVQSGDSSVNNNLNTGTGGNSATNMDVTAWDFFDTDGDNSWTAGDRAYIDADTGGTGNAFATIIDLRLSGTAPTGTAPTDGTTDGTDGTTDGTDGTTDGNQTDGTDGNQTDGDGAVDEQARQDAQEAKQSAQEAKQSADEAKQTAQEAKQAAEQARDASQDTQKSVNRLADQLNESGQQGTPGFGVLAALGAFVGLAAVLKLRD